jgi:crotonobetainyl-CoA:carnitine CoA-transferase CaiB-like acyl-CoA transferase
VSKEALSGLKVLEYSEFISGPYCGKFFADLGAEVIKVEKPGVGDRARNWGPFPQDIPDREKSGLFLYLNTNKSSVTLNINSAVGLKIFKELIKWADIIIEDNAPLEMKRLHLDYENLHHINPRLVVTSITPFGQTGPYRDYKGSDLITFNMGGDAYLNPSGGVDDAEQQPPLKVPAHTGDFFAGLGAAISSMSAIISQRKTGQGQQVDLSQQEAMVHMVCHQIGDYTSIGATYKRKKAEQSTGAAEVQTSKNGYIFMLMFGEAAWTSLVEMMGNPEWAMSDQYKDISRRRTRMGEINQRVAEWVSQHTNEEIMRLAENKRIPVTPLNTIKETIESEQLKGREFFVEIDHKKAGKFVYPGAPYKLSGTPWRIKTPAPLLGEHNKQVYSQILGYSDQDIVKMRQAGII